MSQFLGCGIDEEVLNMRGLDSTSGFATDCRGDLE